VRNIVDASTGAAIDLTDWVGVVSSSHRARSSADLYRAGQLVTPDLPVSSMSATFNRSGGVRGRARATIAPAAGLAIAPFGDELRLWRWLRLRPRRAYGTYIDYVTQSDDYVTSSDAFVVLGDDFAVFGTDVEERWARVSLGFMPVQDADQDGDSLEWDIDMEDRSRMVADALTEDVIEWFDGDILEIRIEEMVRDAVPSIPFASRYEGTTHPAPLVKHERGTDPWRLALESAEVVGYETYFDSDGSFVWRPEPDLRSADPAATFTTGAGGNVAPGVRLRRSRRDAYNSAPVTGNNLKSGPDMDTEGAPFYANELDDDPNSDTQYNGVFGKKPMSMLRDDEIDSQAKANAASTARLVANLGVDRVVSFTAVPNPVVEPGDAVTFIHHRLGLNEAVLIESQTIGDVESPMTITARTKRTVQA
jgi:hypothetical protein